MVSLDENRVTNLYFSAGGDMGFCVLPEGREVLVGKIKSVGGKEGKL